MKGGFSLSSLGVGGLIGSQEYWVLVSKPDCLLHCWRVIWDGDVWGLFLSYVECYVWMYDVYVGAS